MKWCCDFIRRRSSASDHHQMWRTTARLQPEQWGVTEHEALLNIVELAGTFDQLDFSNCVFAEAILRRVQVIERAYVEKLKDAPGVAGNSRLEAEEVAAFSGRTRHSENALMVCPE